jgi:hypothetical protein
VRRCCVDLVVQRGGVVVSQLRSAALVLWRRCVRLYPPYAVTSLLCYAARFVVYDEPFEEEQLEDVSYVPDGFAFHCSTKALAMELVMTQTSLPFPQHCTPWLWPVALVVRLSAVTVLVAWVSSAVFAHVRALSRLTLLTSRLFRRLRVSPVWLLHAMCLTGVAICVVRAALALACAVHMVDEHASHELCGSRQRLCCPAVALSVSCGGAVAASPWRPCHECDPRCCRASAGSTFHCSATTPSRSCHMRHTCHTTSTTSRPPEAAWGPSLSAFCGAVVSMEAGGCKPF